MNTVILHKLSFLPEEPGCYLMKSREMNIALGQNQILF